MKNYILFFLSVLCFFDLYSQEFPPISSFTKESYDAGIQNWMITQDTKHFIYFANNEGLLEYNGSNFTLYPSPNETIIRSVAYINNKIYTGCYMDFGYWQRLPNGKLNYHSLSKKIKLLDDEQFWAIFPYENWVVFQSLKRIYALNNSTNKLSIIENNSNILKSFKTSKGIYFQTNNGLFEIENGKRKPLISNDLLKDNRIVEISEANNGLLIVTEKLGVLKYVDGKLVPFATSVDEQIKQSVVYSSKILSDKSFAIGTISDGVFIINPDGTLKYHINQKNGLNNNTILSMYEDIDKNLWLGLDNGINCINLNSNLKKYHDNSGLLGTVYASIEYNGNLYIGTNQGLFFKKNNSNENFKFISGTKGQVWNLFLHENTLFCGHDSGTFIVNGNSVERIFSESGTWKFQVFGHYIIQGNYYGLSILEKKNNVWVFKTKFKGFDYSSKHFETLNNKIIYVSHEYKGVFKLDIDFKNFIVKKTTALKEPSKGKNASLLKYDNIIYYAFSKGVYRLDTKNNQFLKDNYLSKIFENNEYITGKMVVDSDNNFWFFTQNYMHSFSKSKLSADLKRYSLPISSSLTNSMPGYENIALISNNLYLIGTTDGYYLMKNSFSNSSQYEVQITSVTSNKLNQNISFASLKNDEKFSNDNNNLSFNYTIPQFDKYILPEYQFKLEGFQDDWSEWSTKPSTIFKNLPAGDYKFYVKAKIANSIIKNIAKYSFTIKKPWYFNNFAVFLYFILGIGLFYFLTKKYNDYHNKKHEKIIAENNLLLELKELENQKEIMNIKNEQLTKDVDKKNKELAASTMDLIEKTQLLNIIKEDLKNTNTQNSKDIKSIISTINTSVKEEDTWNKFKEAFDAADKDFLKNMKQVHPSLTPNDLRLCAYLRINLTSKEIAPLLNISVRSVEIKRYRLRKKMNITHEQGLVEYILSI